MPSSLTARVTQRVSLRTLLLYLLVAGGVVAFTGNVALVAGLATAFLIVETRQVLIDTPGIDNRWVTVGLAVVLLAVSLVWLVAEFRQPAALRVLWAHIVAAIGGLSGAAVIQSVVPACGLIAAVGAVRLRHGPLP